MDQFSFVAPTHKCDSSYIADDGILDWQASCKVPEGFSATNYQTSPDGNFRIKLKTNPSKFAIDKVAKLEIHFDGSYVPFKAKNQFQQVSLK